MTTTDTPTVSDLPTLIGDLVRRIANLGTGPQAELRRLRPDADDRWRSPIFYQLYALITPDGDRGEEHQRRWAMLLSGMVTIEHSRRSSLGRVLAESGFAEIRLVRLLDADPALLGDHLRTTVAFLAAKGAEADWCDLARLVLSCGGDEHDAVRRRIAQSYYRFLA